MNFSAVHHEMSMIYTYVHAHQEAIIKIRVAKEDIMEANVLYADKYLYIYGMEDLHEAKMVKVATSQLHDYYEARLPLRGIVLKYNFELIDGHGDKHYFGAGRFYNQKPGHFSQMFDFTRRAREEDSLETPAWAKGAVVYQIFPERYHPGTEPTKRWYGHIAHNTKLGGTLQGIILKLPYIADLGVDIVYLTPIFESPSNHKYNTTDYYRVDPDFGTNEDFRELVDKSHALGMRVIIDGVFNHSGDTFGPFLDVKEKGEASPYADWFEIDSFPIHQGSRTSKPSYDAFAYHGSMPKLKTKSQAMTQYLLDVAAFWTREYGIDGWRLDVADEVSHEFWKKFRQVVREINPEALIVGEVWYDASEWLRGDEFDTVMNYKFYGAQVDFIAKRTIHVREFADRINEVRGIYPLTAYELMWNLIDSHDTERFLYQAGESVERLKLAVLMQMTMTGMPFVYYGDEVGMTGAHDPDCRRGMLWDPDKQDLSLRKFYQDLIALRKKHKCLGQGSHREVLVDDSHQIYGFEKSLGNEKLMVIINNGEASSYLVDYKGNIDLVSGETFDGHLKPNRGVILQAI